MIHNQKYHYLLDSNVISEIIKPEPSFDVIKKIAEHSGDCAISVTTWHELVFGVEQLEDGFRKTELKKFIQDDVKQSFDIIPYTQNDAQLQGQIRAKLKTEGFPISFADSQIAAIAITNNMILSTRNTKDFLPIANYFPLKLENWWK